MLLFFDGFDGYDASADLTNFGKWDNVSVALSSTVRVGSGKCADLTSWDHYFEKYRALTGKTLFIGCSFYYTGAPWSGYMGGNNGVILAVNSAALTPQIVLAYNNITKKIVLLSTTSGSVLSTGNIIVEPNTYRYIECKVLVDNSAGIFEVRVDGVLDITYSGDTQYQSTNAVGSVSYGLGAGTSNKMRIDDCYICDSLGTINNTYLGEQRSEIITPASDSSVAWTRNTGASNFSAVDDAIGAPDDNTTYVSSSTSTQKDEYGLSDLTGVNAVAGVKLVTRAQKDDVNPLSFKHGIKSGAVDQQVTYSLGIGYANFIDIFETSDGAGTAFTPTTVNSLLSTIEVA